MSNKIIVGEKIKSIREQKQLTVEALSERSGVSEEVINFIENEKDIPALAPLIKISRGLGVRLGTFLDDSEELGPVVTRANNMPAGISLSNNSCASQEGMNYYSLAQSKSGRHMEPFFITLEEGEKKDFPASAHEGEEFIYVLDGELELDYGKSQYRLGKGDSIYFDSIVKHHLHAAAGKKATFIAVLYTLS
ncbi:MAG: helix-turn-helix transcriptional regulator [Paludibacteraceae bacterium]|nr:helix-turn-helix transcriptional regulator [Paludibacteraceae bacterium]MBR6043418.1 helix-turn-helix transcriptional regulator [Paludibacteraceae bacterium]